MTQIMEPIFIAINQQVRFNCIGAWDEHSLSAMDADWCMFVASGHLGKYSFCRSRHGSNYSDAFQHEHCKIQQLLCKMHAACVKFQWRIICLDCSRSVVRPHILCFCLPLINMHLLFMMSRKNLEHDRGVGRGVELQLPAGTQMYKSVTSKGVPLCS